MIIPSAVILVILIFSLFEAIFILPFSKILFLIQFQQTKGFFRDYSAGKLRLDPLFFILPYEIPEYYHSELWTSHTIKTY